MERENRKTLALEEHFAKDFFNRIRYGIYGKKRPHWFVQMNYYVCSILVSCALIWQLISYFILKNPDVLKQHKHVDVQAIVERRGVELGFLNNDFYDTLLKFSLYSSILCVLMLISLFFLWRKKAFYIYLVIGIEIIYVSLILAMLGGTYFIEDTTLFDKLSLLVIFVLTILQNFLIKRTFTENSEEITPLMELNEGE